MAKNERRKRPREVQGGKKKSKRVVATLAKENACSQLYDELKGEE